MKKRILCLLLVLAIFVGLLPALVLDSSAAISTTTEEIDSLFYRTLSGAASESICKQR